MARRDRELDHEFRMRLVQAISTGWQGLMRLGCVIVFCLCAYYAVRELAGKQTLADVNFKAIADLKANRWFGLVLPWVLCGAFGIWGTGERLLRKQHIKRVSSESSEMQKFIDPGRRSSLLSKKGDTNKEDI
jgi:hypothetical protein